MHTACLFLLGLPLLSVACGGSQPPPKAAPPPEKETFETIEDDKTGDSEHHVRVVRHEYLRLTETCAQSGVYEIDLTGSRWGEQIEIQVRSKGHFSGRLELSIVGDPSHYQQHWEADNDADNTRCRGGHVATASASAGAKSSGKGGAPSSSGSSSAPSVPDAKLVSIGKPDDLPSARWHYPLQWDHTRDCDIPLDAPPIASGRKLRLKFWDSEPIDWSGVVIEIEQTEILPHNDTRWRTFEAARCEKNKAILKAYNDHWQSCQKRLKDTDCKDVTSFDMSGPYEAPPAPVAETPPPKPSQNALWVGGHWQWDGHKWAYWSPGSWKVPDIDRTQQKTATAPTAPPAPPAPKTESPGAKPTPGAVWTPGYWHWDVHVWVWIGGAWRVPPTAGAHWQDFVWRIDASGIVRLDPGGWVNP